MAAADILQGAAAIALIGAVPWRLLSCFVLFMLAFTYTLSTGAFGI